MKSEPKIFLYFLITLMPLLDYFFRHFMQRKDARDVCEVVKNYGTNLKTTL